jgi:arylsulfatase A
MKSTSNPFSQFATLCRISVAMIWLPLFMDSISAEKRKPKEKPNIIIILADDLSYYDLGYNGQKEIKTPNIDRMAFEGRIFSQAYAGAPWCAPSRTALLTGRQDTHFAPILSDTNGQGLKYNSTLAEVLKPAHYTSCAIGKWHMLETSESISPSETEKFENWAQMPWHRGFDVCRIGHLGGWNHHFPHQLYTSDNVAIQIPENGTVTNEIFSEYYGASKQYTVTTSGEEIYNSEGQFFDGSGKSISQLRYSEEIYRQEAIAFMRNNANKPFFLYYASTLVHFPIFARDLQEFKDKPASWTVRHKAYASMVQDLDQSVGCIIQEVEALGLSENTIIIFTSDNGYTAGFNFPEHNVAWGPQLSMWNDVSLFHNKGPWNRGKHITTAGGVVVPFVAWGPGRIPSGRTDRAINFVDIMATACELAGITPSIPTEGISFVPLLEGRDEAQAVHPPMLWSGWTLKYASMDDDWETDAPQISHPKPHGLYHPDAALINERWFAMDFQHKDQRRLRIFDIIADPGQKKDLAAKIPDICKQAEVFFEESRRLPR